MPFEKEILTPTQKLNEYIMTSLRTLEGLNLEKLENEISLKLRDSSRTYIENGLMIFENEYLRLTNKGKLMADGITANLFF